MPNVNHRPIFVIAREIRWEWEQSKNGINYAAKPYLDAMRELQFASDNFMHDSAKSIVLYFLSNASGFRGPRAKVLKAELKAVVGVR